ncbi:hypothetical protein HID58_022369 [Brassica napus]|uniref:Uncharacterized protein n=1 Tax=Brassica napus TaxID=3708 RepID=A0ABQ8CZ40_BRANA|nr:hypothetical protein HID58_022369 [Brassica napus]
MLKESLSRVSTLPPLTIANLSSSSFFRWEMKQCGLTLRFSDWPLLLLCSSSPAPILGGQKRPAWGRANETRHAPSRFSGDYDAGEAHDASCRRSSQSSGNGLMIKSYISLCTWSLFPETMHYLALEIIGVGKKKLYAAKELCSSSHLLIDTNLGRCFMPDLGSFVRFNISIITRLYDEQQQYRQKPENREQQKLKSLKRNRDKTGSHVLIVDHLHNDSKLISDENQWKSKKPRTKKERVGSSKISFKHSTSLYDSVEPYA